MFIAKQLYSTKVTRITTHLFKRKQGNSKFLSPSSLGRHISLLRLKIEPAQPMVITEAVSTTTHSSIPK